MHHHNGGIIHGLVANLRIYVDPYRASCQVDIIGRDADGYFELVFDINRLHETAEKALYLYYETDGGTYLGDARSVFSQGYAAMATVRILEMEHADMRSMTDPYGVVPMPRLYKDQWTCTVR